METRAWPYSSGNVVLQVKAKEQLVGSRAMHRGGMGGGEHAKMGWEVDTKRVKKSCMSSGK